MYKTPHAPRLLQLNKPCESRLRRLPQPVLDDRVIRVQCSCDRTQVVLARTCTFVTQTSSPVLSSRSSTWGQECPIQSHRKAPVFSFRPRRQRAMTDLPQCLTRLLICSHGWSSLEVRLRRRSKGSEIGCAACSCSSSYSSSHFSPSPHPGSLAALRRSHAPAKYSAGGRPLWDRSRVLPRSPSNVNVFSNKSQMQQDFSDQHRFTCRNRCCVVLSFTAEVCSRFLHA